MDDKLFGRLMNSCDEVLEHQKGNIELKTTVVSTDDFIVRYSQLPDERKTILRAIANDMVIANAKV